MRINVRPEAREDILEIWRYGALTWSPMEADRYYLDLLAAFERLKDNPQMAPVVPEVKVGIRRLLSGAHCVYYRVEGLEIIVLRVLHQSADSGLRF
jgi:toxin ParE1/3/4